MNRNQQALIAVSICHLQSFHRCHDSYGVDPGELLQAIYIILLNYIAGQVYTIWTFQHSTVIWPMVKWLMMRVRQQAEHKAGPSTVGMLIIPEQGSGEGHMTPSMITTNRSASESMTVPLSGSIRV